MDAETLTWALVNGNRNPSVTLYPRGCIMHRPGRISNPTGKGGGKRGKVKTFTKASRRRLRKLLLTREWAPGFSRYGATFTVPGPVVTPEQYRDLWADFSRDLVCAGGVMIWRAEVQQRGATHWHCMVGVRDSVTPDRVGEILRSMWFRVMDRVLGVCDVHYTCTSVLQTPDGLLFPIGLKLIDDAACVPPGGGEGLPRVPPSAGDVAASVDVKADARRTFLTWTMRDALRSELPGAQTRSVDVVSGDEGVKGSWYRYLCDHASKTKRGQVGHYIGRHWGVVGRAHLRVVPGVSLGELSSKQFARYTAHYARLCTPRWPDASVPFGRKLGPRFAKARGVGNHAFFCRPDTVSRLMAWARGECPPVVNLGCKPGLP